MKECSESSLISDRTATSRSRPEDDKLVILCPGRNEPPPFLPRRSATVGEAPVAAPSQTEARWISSAPAHIRPCCGWSFGHSRAPAPALRDSNLELSVIRGKPKSKN